MLRLTRSAQSRASSPGALRRAARFGLAGVLLAGATAAVTASGSAQAADYAAYEMPFPCGQMWTGTTRSYHSPSANAVDFNRPDDLGDRVVASAGGTVITAYSYPSGGYGRWVRIDHGDDRTTIYAHLNSTAVKVGQRVSRGQTIGTLGTSGNSTGPHLHYEQRKGSRVLSARFHGSAYPYGTSRSQNCNDAAQVSRDVPMAGDMVAGPRAELVIFRPGSPATFIVKRYQKPDLRPKMGGPAAKPVIGDWDGKRKDNLGVRIPALAQFRTRTPAGTERLSWGRKSDRPVAGDWDGDGDDELGLHRPGRRKVLLRDDDGSIRRLWLGDRDDIAVTGDWNGDGRTDTAAYDSGSARFVLRTFEEDGKRSVTPLAYGSSGDLPVAGDWNGDGTTDLGVWRPSTGTFLKRVPTGPDLETDYRTVPWRFGQPR